MDLYHIILAVVIFFLIILLYRNKRRQIILNRLLSVISKQIVLLENMESVSAKIKNTLMKYLDAINVSIILYDEENKDYRFLNPEDVNKGIDDFKRYLKFFMYLESVDSIMHERSLQKKDDESFVQEGINYFKDLDAVVVLPLIFERRLIGIINIEKKKDNKKYSSFDLDLLENLRPILSVTFANALLYSSISKIYEESEARNTDLENLDKAKSAFLANLSHELKGPVIRARKEISDSGLEKASKYLDDVEHTVSAVHLYSKLQIGQAVLDKDEDDLIPIVRQCISDHRPKEGVCMDYDGPGTLRFSFDSHKIKAALCQLLSNAVKFTDKGNIIVSVEGMEDEVVLRVDDTGSGIPENRLGSVFDMFLHPDSNLHGGTGLGLALVKKIVELHGGNVSVASKFGEGASFLIELPKH